MGQNNLVLNINDDQASLLIGVLGKERDIVAQRLSERRFKVANNTTATLSIKFKKGLETLITNDEARLNNIDTLIAELRNPKGSGK